LEFIDDSGQKVGAKFDEFSGIEVIDRKINPFFSRKYVDEARRQSLAAKRYGLKPVWELRDSNAVNAAKRFVIKNGFDINVRLVGESN